MIMKRSIEQQLWRQHIGTGYLVLKTGPQTLYQVEVYIRPKDGVLCRIQDGHPVFPVELSPEDEALSA